MKIKFSQNIDDVGVAIEVNKDEIGGAQKLRDLADKFQKEMSRAYEAAEYIWKHYPEFRQVTLDTMTDEERKMIELSENSNNKN